MIINKTKQNKNQITVDENRKKPKDAKTKKTIASQENKLKILTRDLYLMQMPSNFFLVLVFVSAYGFLSSLYDAYVVAQLPFEPFSLLQNITHRGLPGHNARDCSMTFLLIMCSMSLRTNLKKYLGFAPNVSTNPWMPNMDDWDDFDQSIVSGADCHVYVRFTDDDPTSSGATWSDWERLEAAEFNNRAFEFYALLTRESTDINLLVDELGVDAETIT